MTALLVELPVDVAAGGRGETAADGIHGGTADPAAG